MVEKMNMQKVFDCIFTRPFAEDDDLLNDFINHIEKRVSWRMLERQEDICYMINERNPPMLKDNVIEVMQNEIYHSLGSIVHYIIVKMLISYRLSNVDLGDEAEWYLREEFDDEDWVELNKAINTYIWEDYSKNLGVEKAKEYFLRINHPEYIMED